MKKETLHLRVCPNSWLLACPFRQRWVNVQFNREGGKTGNIDGAARDGVLVPLVLHQVSAPRASGRSWTAPSPRAGAETSRARLQPWGSAAPPPPAPQASRRPAASSARRPWVSAASMCVLCVAPAPQPPGSCVTGSDSSELIITLTNKHWLLTNDWLTWTGWYVLGGQTWRTCSMKRHDFIFWSPSASNEK